MVHPLIGVHAFIGELGALLFLWVFVELLNPTQKRINRAKIVSVFGLIFILLAWIIGGYYYLYVYGPQVKPLIKAGPTSWSHSIFMEAKEHIFLFLPFLSVLIVSLIYKEQKSLLKDKKMRNAVLSLCALVVLLALAIAFMGYMISAGARTALEALV